jgi:hypothetical protein
MDIKEWIQGISDCGNPASLLASTHLGRNQAAISILEKSPVRDRSLDSSFLEPANYPSRNEGGARKRRAPSSTAGNGFTVLSEGSSKNENKLPSEDKYRRKPRRKTRTDLYEPKLSQRPGKEKESSRMRKEGTKEKSKDDSQRRSRKTDNPKIRDFQASNVGPGRLTVSSASSLIQSPDRKGRSSNTGDSQAFFPILSLREPSGTASVGNTTNTCGVTDQALVPDLAFSELTFLQTQRTNHKEPSENAARRRAKAKETVQRRGEEIATYFAHGPPANRPRIDKRSSKKSTQLQKPTSVSKRPSKKEAGSTSSYANYDQLSRFMSSASIDISTIREALSSSSQRRETLSSHSVAVEPTRSGEAQRRCGRLGSRPRRVRQPSNRGGQSSIRQRNISSDLAGYSTVTATSEHRRPQTPKASMSRKSQQQDVGSPSPHPSTGATNHMTLERQDEAHSLQNIYSPEDSAHHSRPDYHPNPTCNTAVDSTAVGKREYAYVESYSGSSSSSFAIASPAKAVKVKMGRREEEANFGCVGQEAGAASEHITQPMVYPELHGMASVPSMDAQRSPEAQGDMEYHDWDPCELYPQTEQIFDANEESLDMLPGVTDAGGRRVIAQHSPTWTVGSTSDHIMEVGMDPPVCGERGRRWSINMSGANEAEAGAENGVILPPGFWKPNMLYEKKRVW